MSIPGVDTHPEVPPPLPPPRMPFGNTMPPSHDLPRHRPDLPPSHTSFARNHGSPASPFAEDEGKFPRKDLRHAVKEEKDEGYSSWSSIARSQESFPRAFGLHHNSFQFQSSADLHGASLKKKLETARSPAESKPISLLTASANELLPKPLSDSRYSPALSIPSQLPLHTRAYDSPRSSDTGPMSALSPRSAPFQQHAATDYRSAHEHYDPDRSPRTTRTSRNNSDDASSTQGSYADYGYADEMDMDETSDLKRLQLSDGYASIGQKRRAASPPPNDTVPLGLQGKTDLVIRRSDLSSRGSPTPRLSGTLQNPLSSLSRSNSYMSVSSVAPTTHDRWSPGGGSPGGVSPTSATSPYTTPLSLQTHSSFGMRTPFHARTSSATSPKQLVELQKPVGPKVQGFLMCECCPKKPKKFETREELRAHEAEKQYTCQYCGNRFKNKNEAERHMNSLHLRRHSWSCSVLASYDRAFHESTNYPGQADTCGYCGEDFHRSGAPASSRKSKITTDEDWDARIRHLQEVHKFGECNSSKKFFRADHFRQHLKHSHAGTSGKWTNMLETACMIEEEPRHKDEVSL